MNKKEIAQDFLKLAAKGDSRKAFSLYTAKNCKHHNAFFKGDGESLMIAMEEAAKANPNTTVDVQRILQDGDLVAVHSHVKHNATDPGFAAMHIFRFEAGKVVEFWDFAQAVPATVINEHGMF